MLHVALPGHYQRQTFMLRIHEARGGGLVKHHCMNANLMRCLAEHRSVRCSGGSNERGRNSQGRLVTVVVTVVTSLASHFEPESNWNAQTPHPLPEGLSRQNSTARTASLLVEGGIPCQDKPWEFATWLFRSTDVTHAFAASFGDLCPACVFDHPSMTATSCVQFSAVLCSHPVAAKKSRHLVPSCFPARKLVP